MWTCVKCNQNIDDQYTACPFCGAPRSVGRFSKGIQPRQTPKAHYVQQSSAPTKAGRGFLAFGAVLAVLLPGAVILLAALGWDQWTRELQGFLFSGSDPAEKVSLWTYMVYALFSVGAALLSVLPGLWTMGIGKMLRRLGRIEEKL